MGSGTIETHTHTLSGEIRIDVDRNQVLIKEGLSYNLVHASNIKRVNLISKDKTYTCASFGENEDWMIFEILSEGKIPLLYREGIKMSRYDETEFPPFYMLVGSSIYPLDSKRQLLVVFDQYESRIKSFLKDHKTSFADRKQLTSLFDFCNNIE